MAIRKIARLGHPVLRQPATFIPLEHIQSAEIQQIIQDMKDTVDDADGAGLAAPQIFESKQIVLLDIKDGNGMQFWVNPTLTALSEEMIIGFEGCLSVPNMKGAVARFQRISVDAWNEKGEEIHFELEGHPAVVAQHEFDHLQGTVYVDRVEPYTLCFREEFNKHSDVLWQYIESSLEEIPEESVDNTDDGE